MLQKDSISELISRFRKIKLKMHFLNFLHFTRQNPRNRTHLYLRLKDLLLYAIEDEHIKVIEGVLGLCEKSQNPPALDQRIGNIESKIKEVEASGDSNKAEEQEKELTAVKKALNTKSLFESYSRKIDDAQDDFDELFGIVKALNVYLKTWSKEKKALEDSRIIKRILAFIAPKYRIGWQQKSE